MTSFIKTIYCKGILTKRNIKINKIFSVLLIFCGFGTVACGQKNYSEKLKSLYSYTVPLVKPGELHNWKDSGESIVLLDTRTSREYEVSHLKNAKFINYDEFEVTDVQDIPKDKKIVVYCAVGYRSERVGESLQEAGYLNVYNLYGGIFEWKNQGYPVVNNNNNPTDSVHTYSKSWSKWLKKGIKVYD